MLGRDLLRARLKEGRVEPIWLGKSPSIRDLAEQLLALYRGSIGGSRAEIKTSSRRSSTAPAHR